MTYHWYKIFNLTTFLALGLISKEYTYLFDGAVEKTILVTQGDEVSVLFDEILLTIGLNDYNPFAFEDRAVYVDDNDDVFVGVLVDED